MNALRSISKTWLPAITLAGFVFIASPIAVAAQKSLSDSAMLSETATIEAIDSANRIVTLKLEDGSLEEMYAGPEVKRFAELKVGDKVTFRYHESLVMQLHKTDQPLSSPTLQTGIVRGTGEKPGATMSQQYKATVMVEAIDQKIPSITVKTASGNKLSYKVEDPKNLEGVAVGDHIEITYTQALIINVESPKE